MQRQLTLAETGEPQTAQLTEDEAAALTATGLAIVQRTAALGEWHVAADRKVGTLQVGPDLQVTVTPKVKEPATVVLPLNTPALLSDRPVGSAPEASAN